MSNKSPTFFGPVLILLIVLEIAVASVLFQKLKFQLTGYGVKPNISSQIIKSK